MTADKSVVFRATVVDGRLVLTSDAPLSVKDLLGCTLDAGELADEVVLHPRDKVYSQRQQLISVAPGVMEEGPITCGLCGEEFKAEA